MKQPLLLRSDLRLLIAGLMSFFMISGPALSEDVTANIAKHAYETACALGYPALDFSNGGELSDGDEAEHLVVRRTIDWASEYNIFADSEEARFLRQYANLAYKIYRYESNYPEPVCTILRPTFAIALSADVLRSYGGGIIAGAFLATPIDAPLPESIRVISRKCSVQPFGAPQLSICED
ncbi:MAG: hypothetical protein AAF950_18390 [Pseudomonadota bacterium]